MLKQKIADLLFRLACVLGRPIHGLRPRRMYDWLARHAYAYKGRFFHSPLPTAQLARNISSVPGNLGQASGCPGLTGRS